MRFTRKTIVALGVSGALTVMAGVSASAAVLDLPILGFGEAATETAAAPQVVHRTVYDDHYVTATTAPRAATPGITSRGSTAAAPATTAAPVVAPTTAAPAPSFQAASVPAPASTPAPTPTTPAAGGDDSAKPPVTTGRPPVPAGCIEPEWDAEHGFWHCANKESPGD